MQSIYYLPMMLQHQISPVCPGTDNTDMLQAGRRAYVYVYLYVYVNLGFYFISQVHMALYSRYANVRLKKTLWARIQDYIDMMWAAF